MSNFVRQTESDIMLPALPEQMLPALASLTTALGIPRGVLAPDEEIAYAWNDLPRELRAIPPALRGELIARMCVAVSVGLFDGAINYIWNATVLHMRQRIRELLVLTDFVVTNASPPSRKQSRDYAASLGDSESH
jgi:hypothetical protein